MTAGANTGRGTTTTGGAQTGTTGAHTTRGGGGKPKEMVKLKSARAGVTTEIPKARAPISIMVLVFITEGSTRRHTGDSRTDH